MFWKENNLLKFSFSQENSENWISFTLYVFSCQFPSYLLEKPFCSVLLYFTVGPHLKFIKKQLCMCILPFPWKMFPSLKLQRKFCSEEKTVLTCHSLIVYINKSHFSPLCWCFPFRLKRNQGIELRIGYILDRIRPRTFPRVESDCQCLRTLFSSR